MGGGKIELTALTLGGAFGVHASTKKSKPAENSFFFALPLFSSHRLGGGGERGAGVSLLSSVMLFVFVPAGMKGENSGHCFLLGFPR